MGQLGFAAILPGVAEEALLRHGLLARPIAYFEYFDRFEGALKRLEPEWRPFLGSLDPTTSRRAAVSYAFADELARDALLAFCPDLPQAGRRAQRILWAAAVLLDQILDETEADASSLRPVRDWLAGPRDAPAPRLSGTAPKALAAMLSQLQDDCRRRGAGSSRLSSYETELLDIMDAELASTRLGLRRRPDDSVREAAYRKSVALCRLGLQACLLGAPGSPIEMREPRLLCDAIGEILWIMDDLADLDEDLDRGLWNRTLWRLWDEIGEKAFREALESRRAVHCLIRQRELIEEAFDEIQRRIAFLESHPAMKDPSRLRTLLSVWLTASSGIYG